MAKYRSDFTPDFGYEDETGRYRWLNGPNAGKFAPGTAVREALDEYLDNKTNEVRGLAEQLRNREISIADWQLAMERNIANIHLASGANALGGWAGYDQTEYGRVGGYVKYEYRALNKFAQQIEDGLPLDGHFLQRAMQYAQAGRHTYHEIETLQMIRRGYREERSIRHAGDSCDECVSIAGLGWQPIGSTKQPGERTCRRNCRCTKEYRK